MSLQGNRDPGFGIYGYGATTGRQISRTEKVLKNVSLTFILGLWALVGVLAMVAKAIFKHHPRSNR